MSIFDWFRGDRDVVTTPPAVLDDDTPSKDHEWSTHNRTAERLQARLADVGAAAVHKNVKRQAVATDVMDAADNATSISSYTGLTGDTVPESLMLWYVNQGFIGYQLAGLLAQHWLIAKACLMPAQDAMRNGFDIVAADGDEIDPDRIKLMNRWNRRFKLRQHLEEFVFLGRVYGIRIAIFKVRSADKEYYTKPFNPDGITPGSYKGIVQVDPYWCAPMLDARSTSQPDAKHFYEPTWWQINGKLYHRSHLVIYRTGMLPDILKPQYQYGAVPVPQRIMERVYAAERTANEGPQLAMTKRVSVWYTNLTNFWKNIGQGIERLTMWRTLLDNYGVKVGDKTADSYEQFDTSLADLDAVIMTQYQLVAAGADVPATKLMGTSPKGFGGEGHYEEKSYAQFLESVQTSCDPLIERHLLMMDRSIVVPKMKLAGDATAKPVECIVEWNPVDSPDAIEEADIRLKDAQTAEVYVGLGSIDQYDVRDKLRKDKNSGYAGIAEAIRPTFEPGVTNATQANLPGTAPPALGGSVPAENPVGQAPTPFG